MFNSFPPLEGLKLRMNTLLRLLQDLSDGSVLEACKRFSSGECGRRPEDRRFAPSNAEICALARECENQIRARETVVIQGPVAIKRGPGWERMQARVAATIASYRRTYAEALKTDPGLRYTDHVMSEFKRATGHELRIPRPRADAPKQRAV
jgi:hypothetical protein